MVTSNTDKGGIIFIVTALGLALALLSLLIRVYVRHGFSRDDLHGTTGSSKLPWRLILAVSTSRQLTLEQIISIFQNAVVFVEVNRGLGRSSDDVTSQQSVELLKVPLPRSVVAERTN